MNISELFNLLKQNQEAVWSIGAVSLDGTAIWRKIVSSGSAT